MKVSAIIFCLCITTLLHAQPQKELYIANDDHTDYMWSGDENQYRDAFIKMLDYYLEQSDQTAALPSPFQSRFNCDGSYWLWVYEKHKSSQEFQRLIDKIRSGNISMPYNTLVSCYGAVPAEGILRGMYYAGHLERKYNLDLNLGVAMENQTLPLGLGSLWAGAGVKYSWKGVCNCATEIKDLKSRNKQIYWYKGLDNSAVLMKWYAIPGENKQLGGYAEARDPSLAVDQLNVLCGSSQYPYHIGGAFGYGWDDLQTTTTIFTTTAQEKTTDDRHVFVSNQSDFFKAFETAYGKDLPHESLSFGNEWDLYSSSMAELSARVKRSVEKLRSAEAMASIVGLQDKNFGNDLEEMRRTAWMALGLYYEHNWTADGPVKKDERAAWQRKVEAQLSNYVDSLFNRSQRVLGSFINNKKNRNRFYAFNPLSWERTDVCDFPYSGTKTIKVTDIHTNKEVPSQIIAKAGKQYVRILASNVPSLGYRVYQIAEGKPSSLPVAAVQNNNVFENNFFKITVTRQGVITSLVDKRYGNREWVANVGGKLMNDLGSGLDNTGKLVVTEQGPVSLTIECTGGIPLKHTTRITLFKDIPRIDINNQITQNFSNVERWSFSYNLPDADVWHEETGAVLKARLHIDSGHYATQNGRYDWLTLNHFADVNNGKQGIMLSNADCAFMKLGNSALTNLDTQTPQISVLVGGQVDGETLGIQKQDGDSLFTQRFALGTHNEFSPAATMRFSLEHQNPLVSGQVTGSQPFYPESDYSFLSVDDPDILVWSLKPPEDGLEKGLIVRLWNFKQKDTSFGIHFKNHVDSAFQTTHVETDIKSTVIQNGALQESIGKNQLKTFRVMLKNDSGK